MILNVLLATLLPTFARPDNNDLPAETATQLSLEKITKEGAIELAHRAHELFKPKFSKNPVSEQCRNYDSLKVRKFNTRQKPVKNASSMAVVDKVTYVMTVTDNQFCVPIICKANNKKMVRRTSQSENLTAKNPSKTLLLWLS